MDKSVALLNAEYKSGQISTLFEVIFDHICEQEVVDRHLLDLIGIACDLNNQIKQGVTSAMEATHA